MMPWVRDFLNSEDFSGLAHTNFFQILKWKLPIEMCFLPAGCFEEIPLHKSVK